MQKKAPHQVWRVELPATPGLIEQGRKSTAACCAPTPSSPTSTWPPTTYLPAPLDFLTRKHFPLTTKPKPKKTIYCNSETGRITTKQYAEENPKTTEKEQVRK